MNLLLIVSTLLPFMINCGLAYMLWQQSTANALLRKKVDDVRADCSPLLLTFPALLKADVTFDERMMNYEKQLLNFEQKLQALSNVRLNDSNYQHAFKILALGGEPEEIAKSCHLSKAEANLLANLHAYRSALEKSDLNKEIKK